MVIHQLHNTGGNHNYNAFIYENCHWYHHFHKNLEIAYVMEGQVEITLNGSNHLLSADTFTLILPNVIHAYHTPVSSKVWIGVFSVDFVTSFGKMIETKQASFPFFHCKPQIRDFLLHCLITEEKQDILMLKSALYAFCSEFLSQVQLQDAKNENDFIYNILSFVANNYQNNITLSSVADNFGYEYHYLSKRFHQSFHMHFSQFLNRYRTDHAQELLLHTDGSISEIAFTAGFQNLRTFNRVFLSQTGMSPSQFRQSQRTNQTVIFPSAPLP